MQHGCCERCVGSRLHCASVCCHCGWFCFPLQVKLVRTQGEMWEVASMQNTETLSALSSLKQVPKV